jgi:predicted nucleic acid-binding protein
VLVALCAKEPHRYETAHSALADRIGQGCTLYAPHLIVMEVLYVLCRRRESGALTPGDHDDAVANLVSAMSAVVLPAQGDVVFVERAEELREGYGCSRSADSLYLALAESLAREGAVELLTYDGGLRTQAARWVPSLAVTVL